MTLSIRFRVIRFFFASALGFSAQSAVAQGIEWSSYRVMETGAAVDVPVNVFSEDAGPPASGYGRLFKTSDGRADLAISSVENSAGDSPTSFLRKNFRLPPSAAIYRRVTSNLVAISGFRDDKIWYARCNFTSRFIHCVQLNYPTSEKRNWDGAVTRISNSLSARP